MATDKPRMRRKGDGFSPSTPAVYREMRAKANKGGAVSVWMIEGESLTLAQIGERLGINARQATSRMRQVRRTGRAVTWDNLRQ